MSVTKIIDFTDNGVVVIPCGGGQVEITMGGVGLSDLSFVKDQGNVANDLTGQTGTFGGGTVTIQRTGLSWVHLGMDYDTWANLPTGTVWQTVEMNQAGLTSWTTDFTGAVNHGSTRPAAPVSFVRVSLTGATNPRIKGTAVIYKVYE